MRHKPLEVTRTSLTTCYTSLCYSCRRNTYSLYKGLLIKYWWLVKCRWCLTSTPWTPSTSLSLLAIYTVQMAVQYNAASLRHKHSPETLFIYRKNIFHILRQCIPRKSNINIPYIKSYSRKFLKFLYSFFFFFFFEIPVNSVHEQCP